MSKEIKLTKAKAFEIDPTKKYIIVFDKTELTGDDVARLIGALKTWGAESVSVLVGNPNNVKVIEL